MTRFSTIWALSGALAALAMSANMASAATITVHTAVPTVGIHPPASKGPKVLNRPWSQDNTHYKGPALDNNANSTAIQQIEVSHQGLKIP
jgi:hypothetical protein